MTDLEVRTADGLLVGYRDAGIDRFFGIPFAAAPVGAFRWAPAAPPTPWTGRRAARMFGPDSLQPPFEGWGRSRAASTDEDCLYLNVWAPSGVWSAPVLVIVHGGGFQLLSGANDLFDGAGLAAQGVVVVTFNYRLGLLGFAGGAQWLTDQIAALRWVRTNITGFGGDPNRTTIMGMSAGGVSVNALNVSPAAQGLFDQAISISGGGDTLFREGDFPPIPGPDEHGEPPVYREAFANGAGEYAIVDGTLVPDFPSALLRQGRSNARRLIFAFSTFESSLLDQIGLSADHMAAVLRQTYPEAAACPEADGYALYDHLIFRQPALALADAASQGGTETFVLDYAFVPAGARTRLRGATHADAIFDVLGAPRPVLESMEIADSASDTAAKQSLQRRVLNFIRGGSPEDDRSVEWPAHRAGGSDALRIDVAGEASRGAPLGLQQLAGLRPAPRTNQPS